MTEESMGVCGLWILRYAQNDGKWETPQKDSRFRKNDRGKGEHKNDKGANPSFPSSAVLI